MKGIHFLFCLLTASLVIGLIVPVLIQDGMFMDGLLYTCVSKNLSLGQGSFWKPYIMDSWMKSGSPYFIEHPPLVFGIQSVFFRILGTGIHTERIYSFLTAIITIYLIVLTWNQINKNNHELKRFIWLPVLFWISIPVCFWSYQNNMQENTMGIFTLLSVYLSLLALSRQKTAGIILLIFSGVSIFLASFSKGIPGLFPLTIIFLYWLIHREISFQKMLSYSMIIFLVPVIIYFLLMLNKDAYESLSFYIINRAFHRIQSVSTVSTRFYIAWRLLLELLPVLIVCILLYIVFRLKKIRLGFNKYQINNIFLFFLIGCCGSLPIMISHTQKGFYMVASFPFFAIALALAISPGLNDLFVKLNMSKKSSFVLKAFSSLILIATITYSGLQAGKTSREKKILYDIHLFGKYLDNDIVISLDPKFCQEWKLLFYMIRYYNINMDTSETVHRYYLTDNKNYDAVSSSYEKVPLKTKKYFLYKLKNTK